MKRYQPIDDWVGHRTELGLGLHHHGPVRYQHSLCSTSNATTARSAAPLFPSDPQLISFSATLVEAHEENQTVQRLQLTAPGITLIGERIPGLRFTSGPQPGPFVYALPHYPDVHASLYAFARKDFATTIQPEILNQYLARKQLEAPAESQFEIIESAARNPGPAKFRFLGGKAYTLTYDYDKTDSLQQRKRFRCTENWRSIRAAFTSHR